MEAQDWDRKWLERLKGPDRDPNRFLVEVGSARSPGRALDLACGVGRNAVWLAERGWRVTAIDFSDLALEHARARGAAYGVAVDWQRADLREYEPPAGAFELVLVAYLQLPVAERRRVWRRAAAAVAPGGVLIVVGHHRDNLEHGYAGPRSPGALYTEREIAAELDGLAVERAERIERPVVAEDGEHVAIDALVVACRAAG
ncbi:MAG: class I SAM-dependent methyltransferase [Thermoleophilia bacterium]|nr:class I SAM-dependent methyltransferase [Thermoleophilia bacterium]